MYKRGSKLELLLVLMAIDGALFIVGLTLIATGWTP